MDAVVHLPRFCSSYISSAGIARRLLLGACFFPPCHFTPPSHSPLWCLFSMAIHTSVEIAVNFDFSQNALLSSYLFLDTICLSYPSLFPPHTYNVFLYVTACSILCVQVSPIIPFNVPEVYVTWISVISIQSTQPLDGLTIIHHRSSLTWDCSCGELTRSCDLAFNLSASGPPLSGQALHSSPGKCIEVSEWFCCNGTSG